MKDLTKCFIDLSKLSEEQIKSLPQILEKAGETLGDQTDIEGDDLSYWTNFHKPDYATYWTCGTSTSTPEKTELTYPEFIKLFEGGEGEKKCCDNPDIQWNKIEINIGDKQGSYKDLNFNFCDNCGETFNETFD